MLSHLLKFLIILPLLLCVPHLSGYVEIIPAELTHTHSTLQTTIQKNGTFGDNLVQGLKTAAIETGNVMLTRAIGKWVHAPENKDNINPFVHRGLHFGVGAGTGVLLKANPIMAGINQVVGEEIGNLSSGWMAKAETPEKVMARKEKMMDVIKFITALGSLLAGGTEKDISASTVTSGNAFQHNGAMDEYLMELYHKNGEPLKKWAEWLRQQRQKRGESFMLEAVGEKIQEGAQGIRKASGQYWRNREFTQQAQQLMKLDPMGYMDSAAAWSMLLECGAHALAQMGHYMESVGEYMGEIRNYYQIPSNHVKDWDYLRQGTILIPMGFDMWDVLKAGVGFLVEYGVKKLGGSPALAQDFSDVIDPLMLMGGIGAVGKVGTAVRIVTSTAPKVSKALMPVRNVRQLPSLTQKALPPIPIVQYSFKSEIFAPPVMWTSPVSTKQTYKIYQRNDIDWKMIRTEGPEKYIGKSNLEAALEMGYAPQISNSKNYIELHHLHQDARGPLVEVPSNIH